MASIDYDGARNAIIEQVKKQAPTASPAHLLALAEAFAWAMSPNVSHGGGAPAN